MKIHKQITNTLLNHPTEWIGILTTETPFPKLFSQIKPIRYKTGLHCIRFIQLCLKAGYSEEGEEAVQYYKTYFVDQSSKNQNTLFLAVAQWYDFFVSHSEKVKNLKSDFLETITDLHAAEAKYIGYYTLGFYYLARSEFETSRNYFIKLEQVYREYKLEDFGDFNTLRENVEILMNTRDIDEVQSFYEKNIGIFSKNTLQNRVALINICSRRGDYERVASLVTQFPAILLPKYTHIIAGFAAMKPINFNRKKVYADPEAAHVKILEGIYLSDPEFILQNASFKMQIKNSRIRVVCNIGIAWAYQRIGNFDKAIKILNLTEILPIDYDLYLFRNFTIVDILIRSHFSQIKVLSLKETIKTIIFNYKFIIKNKIYDNHIVPGFSEVIWFLACISSEFEEYQNSRKTICLFSGGVLIDQILHTTPIYKAIFEKETERFSQENIKKARQRIKSKIESDKPLIIVNFNLLESAAPYFIQEFPDCADIINSRLTSLAAHVSIST